jgi:uncharacterized repeat protein (TIGR03803 family)
MIDLLHHSRNLAVSRRAGHVPCLLPVLAAVLALVMVDRATAQTFTSLVAGGRFTDFVLSSNTLYTTAEGIGGHGSTWASLIAIKTDGTVTTLLDFSFNSDGFYDWYYGPRAGLLLSSNTLYGTTVGDGGIWNSPTVFGVSTDGTGFATLHSFAPASRFTNNYGQVRSRNSDGLSPGSLILSSNTLYGTASDGGSWGYGTVFAVNADGAGFTNLHSFTPFSANSSGAFTNSDGTSPFAGLVLSGDALYGTAANGGSFGYGTVFKINTDGSGFTTLYSFGGGNNGAYPQASLLLSGNSLYGTTRGILDDYGSSSSGNGTVFTLKTDGTSFTTLHSFTATVPYFTNNECGFVESTNSDGAFPSGRLILSGHTLIGTAANGGRDSGTVFAINTDGTGFTTLHSFSTANCSEPVGVVNHDGASPQGLTLSGNTLYGMTSAGGPNGIGTVFSISFPPQLTIIPSKGEVVLTWPSDYAGFDYTGYRLQSTTNLGSSVWTTNLPAPVVINGKNIVANPVSGTHQFFRLSQ